MLHVELRGDLLYYIVQKTDKRQFNANEIKGVLSWYEPLVSLIQQNSIKKFVSSNINKTVHKLKELSANEY